MAEKKPHQIDNMVFPCLTWFYCVIPTFTYIRYEGGRDYHRIGEQEYGIQSICAGLIMKRICLYYCGRLEYEYDNTIQCIWIRKYTSGSSQFYTMIPDKLCHKK